MSTYSIKDLEELSGVKAHTLRIWESRYKLLSPERTDTNFRFYHDSDLKKILNVALLNNAGFKISKIAKLSDQELRSTILSLEEPSSKVENYIIDLVTSMMELNQFKFEQTLSEIQGKYGFEKAYLKVVFPFLNRTGILWQTSEICSAHEHYASNLIRQKIISYTDQLNIITRKDPKKFLLFLPEGELHELSLLFSNFLIKNRGHNCIYLGQAVPLNDLVLLNKEYNADFLVSSFTTHPATEYIQEYLDQLSDSFKDSNIFIAGQKTQTPNFKIPDNISLLNEFERFIEMLEN